MQNFIIEQLTISSLADHRCKQAFQSVNPEVSQLFYRGNIGLLTDARPRIAVIGTRKMTPAGREATYLLADAAVRGGAAIISGLAFGVDSVAHQATLNAAGRAIAILPSSLTEVYPTHHQQQATDILESGGLLLSEQPHLVQPQKYHFILRNRIMAALADLILVIEAPYKSGSHHTVAYANSLNTPIAAVPGAINNPQAAGTNLLIRDGVHAITSPDDLLSLIRRLPGST